MSSLFIRKTRKDVSSFEFKKLFQQVRWYKWISENGEYGEIISDGKYIVHTNGSLTIIDSQREDEGTYMIEISNSAGNAQEEIEIVMAEPTGKALLSILKYSFFVPMN